MSASDKPAGLQAGQAERFACAFISARRTASVLDLGDEGRTLLDLEAGRAVASTIHHMLLSEGVGAAGLKFGASSASTQEALGLSEPVVAPIYDEWILPSESAINSSRFLQPSLESEIGFRRSGGAWRAAACFEVVDTRWPERVARGGQFFADFAFNGAIVFGSALVDEKALEFQLWHDDECVRSGTCSVSAARQRIAQAATNSDAKMVASGSLHEPVDLTPGVWTLTFAGGRQVSIDVQSAGSLERHAVRA